MKWVCLVCGHVHEGDAPPDVCPLCGVGPEQFDKQTVSDGPRVAEVEEDA